MTEFHHAKSAIGLGLSFVLTSQIYPFMLSSAFTARTAVHEKDQIKNVLEDAEISLFISIVSTLILAYLLKDIITAVGGVIFAVSLFFIYLERGDLI